jgi:hypothetical protein
VLLALYALKLLVKPRKTQAQLAGEAQAGTAD